MGLKARIEVVKQLRAAHQKAAHLSKEIARMSTADKAIWPQREALMKQWLEISDRATGLYAALRELHEE
jgi:hypothetical protein